MKTEELFIDSHKLPKPLPKSEVYELLSKIRQGDQQAKSKLVEHNIRLVLYEVNNRFNSVQYDKKDLVSIGNIGLIKAINTFDTSKKVEFTTYATKCIDNEILMFLRKIKKDEHINSLDETIGWDKDGNDLKLEDTLSADTDLVEDYIENEKNHIIREIVKDLPERDKKIIILHFGLNNEEPRTQKEIANMLSYSRSYISRLITKILKQLKKQLEEQKIIEPNIRIKPTNQNESKKERGKEMPKSLKTLYEYFDSYSKEEINIMIAKLSEEEKALITLRYGEDLDNPIPGKLSKDQTTKFYGSLIPKMKRLLKKPYTTRKSRQKPIVSNASITSHETKQDERLVSPTIKNDSQEETEPDIKTLNPQMHDEFDAETTSVEFISKEECIKILELLRTPTFSQMMNILSVKDAVIISLKLGYIDGKYYSTQEIAQFLDIDNQEVIDTVKKILLLYKENINQFLDNAIKIATEDPTIINKPHTKLMTK